MEITHDVTLSNDEISRYSRHLIMPEVGIEGQRKLKAASVLIVGTGGLGSPTTLYLAAAGIGRMGLVDYDVVDASNLQRQVIHGESTLGISKLDSAEARIRDLNPFIQIDKYPVPLTSDNAEEIIAPYDVVIDGTDNFPTRYLVNDACIKLGKVNVYGSIFRFEGQASVFGAQDGPCYRCLFPEPPPPGLVPSCAEGGVLGILPGTIGTLQATEAIKVILGIGEPLVGRLLLYDALDMSFTTVKVRHNPQCPVCGQGVDRSQVELIDYEQFCGMPAHDHSLFNAGGEAYADVQQLSPVDAAAYLQQSPAPLVLDVRDPHEWDIAALEGSLRIAKPDIQAAVKAVLKGDKAAEDTVLAQIPRDQEIIVHCRAGIRSADVIRLLREVGYEDARLLNLDGGILAWARDVDPRLPSY